MLTALRQQGRPFLVADPHTNGEVVREWVWAQASAPEPLRLYVTGPRGTRWQVGEALARRFVQGIALR